MGKQNDRLRIIVNFKNNELEKEMYDYVKNRDRFEGISSYVKKLIYEDMIKNKKSTEK